MTDSACCDWSISVPSKRQRISFLSQSNQQVHVINILLASLAQSVWQAYDPRFFPFLFLLACALRAWSRKKEKNSVHYLPYGPRTRLIRGIYTKDIWGVWGVREASPSLLLEGQVPPFRVALLHWYFLLWLQVAVYMQQRLHHGNRLDWRAKAGEGSHRVFNRRYV